MTGRCSGFVARSCPVHGTCICRSSAELEVGCPLHGPWSLHARDYAACPLHLAVGSCYCASDLPGSCQKVISPPAPVISPSLCGATPEQGAPNVSPT